MKQFTRFLMGAILISSCHSTKVNIVDSMYVDSLISHFSTPTTLQSNEDEMQFWKMKMANTRPGMVNEQKYANTLMTRFQAFGDIGDLEKADSLVSAVNQRYRKTETSNSITLAGYAMLQHRFPLAHEYLNHAKELGGRKYAMLLTAFDVYFEQGQYDSAGHVLHSIRTNKDFNFFFRLAKWQHLNGSTDSALHSMLLAAEYAEDDKYLRQVALANAGDLCVHTGMLDEAAKLYKESLQLNSTDFHSLTGLGWLAMVNDGNDSLAERIFKFVHTKIKSPDPLLKLSQLEGSKGNKILQKNYAEAFVIQAGQPVYGNMYNKYLIDCYTGILASPEKAEALAKKELSNRATPQTYAWYAWSLAANKKTAEAYSIFKEHVSGKPLEGPELYWMGLLMKKLKKEYNARQFFEAAYKNRFDFPRFSVQVIEASLK